MSCRPALRDVAVLTEPLTIAEKARDQIRQIVRRLPWLIPYIPEDTSQDTQRLPLTAVVLGAGPVGLLGAMTLKVAGCETYVYALAPAPNPNADIVEAIGGKYYSQGRIPAGGTKQALFGHIHLIYEATGVSRLAFEVWKLLGPNSAFIFTGVPGLKAPIEVDTDLLDAQHRFEESNHFWHGQRQC